jgi:hypothetical protein
MSEWIRSNWLPGDRPPIDSRLWICDFGAPVKRLRAFSNLSCRSPKENESQFSVSLLFSQALPTYDEVYICNGRCCLQHR